MLDCVLHKPLQRVKNNIVSLSRNGTFAARMYLKFSGLPDSKEGSILNKNSTSCYDKNKNKNYYSVYTPTTTQTKQHTKIGKNQITPVRKRSQLQKYLTKSFFPCSSTRELEWNVYQFF